MNNEICVTCRFFRSDFEHAGVGPCLRFPPTASGNNQTVWPVVKTTAWCGEYDSAENYKEPKPVGVHNVDAFLPESGLPVHPLTIVKNSLGCMACLHISISL